MGFFHHKKCCFKNDSSTYSIDQVLKKVEWLIGVLRTLGATVFENDVKSSVERILVVHKRMVSLDRDHRLRLVPSLPMDITADVQRKMKGNARSLAFAQVQSNCRKIGCL